MGNVFAGYRRFANVGWIPCITSKEYSDGLEWQYYDSDEHDGTIIAYNLDTKTFAWVEGSDDL